MRCSIWRDVVGSPLIRAQVAAHSQQHDILIVDFPRTLWVIFTKLFSFISASSSTAFKLTEWSGWRINSKRSTHTRTQAKWLIFIIYEFIYLLLCSNKAACSIPVLNSDSDFDYASPIAQLLLSIFEFSSAQITRLTHTWLTELSSGQVLLGYSVFSRVNEWGRIY